MKKSSEGINKALIALTKSSTNLYTKKFSLNGLIKLRTSFNVSQIPLFVWLFSSFNAKSLSLSACSLSSAETTPISNVILSK